MKDLLYIKQHFAGEETGTTVTTDIAPAVSVDVLYSVSESLTQLREALGISHLTPMAQGSTIKLYKVAVKGDLAAQVDEGAVIGLTETKRELVKTVDVTLRKYDKRTTAEAIQRSGRQAALNDTDGALVKKIRKGIKSRFFANIEDAAGTATPVANTLQAGLAAVWGAMQAYYEDEDVRPVYFVSALDVADYLATANISTQTAFGFSYIENFLGLGTAFVVPGLAKGAVYGTAAENLGCAYIPAGGDVAQTFGLTYDESGLIGMKHVTVDNRLSVDTIVVEGVEFYAPDLSGIFKATIGGNASSGTEGGNAGGTEGGNAGGGTEGGNAGGGNG